MDLDPHAPLAARKELFIQAAPEVIWKVHTNVNAWSQWHPGITMAQLEGPLTVGARFRWKSGGLTITSTVHILEPNHRIAWTGKALGTTAKHMWMLQPYQDGTVLVTEESMSGWLIRLLKVLMPTFLEKSLQTWVQSLKSQAERSQRGR